MNRTKRMTDSPATRESALSAAHATKRPRRTFLGLAAAAAASTLAALPALPVSAEATSSSDGDGRGTVAPEFEGAWLATVTVTDGPPPRPAILTFARGGVVTVSDGNIAPATGNVYYGTWIRTGHHVYSYTFLGFKFDAQGTPVGYLRVHETAKLERDGQAYNAVASIEVLDTAWNVIATASATSHATRISAQ